MSTIQRVSLISTGTVQIRPQHVESNGTPQLWWLSTSRKWTEPRPINVYVIEHENGLVLFDTGQDRRSVTDSNYFPGGLAGRLYRRLAKFDIPAEATLTERLAQIGYDISDVSTAILSHLHQDHIGGLRELPPTARVVVSAAELAQVEKRFSTFAGLLEEHILIPGVNWAPITPAPVGDPSIAPFTAAHDVMGDNSLVLLPTPGHTPGSLSLLLRDEAHPPMLFVGDLTYDATLLAADRVPGVGKAPQLHHTTARVNALIARYPGLKVLAAHDPAAGTILAARVATSDKDATRPAP